jgi:hypothetical protein
VVAGEPKTARGRRTLALDPTTGAALRQHRKRQTEERLLAGPHYADSGFAFTTPDGAPIHPNRFSLCFGGMPALLGCRPSGSTTCAIPTPPPGWLQERPPR